MKAATKARRRGRPRINKAERELRDRIHRLHEAQAAAAYFYMGIQARLSAAEKQLADVLTDGANR